MFSNYPPFPRVVYKAQWSKSCAESSSPFGFVAWPRRLNVKIRQLQVRSRYNLTSHYAGFDRFAPPAKIGSSGPGRYFLKIYETRCNL
jgi:hypothetical protein